jgi:AraC family transcriptional regulator of adaptative response / DNA-3-methyladenine glycosylase II
MELDPRTCYRALATRDRRFDGRFYTGVVTTGIYCRPVCPARTPKRENVRFFGCAAAAEKEGFRACRRCRPETSAGTPAWLGTSVTVARALRLLSAGAAGERGLEALADRLGVGTRHLRRLFQKELGASPVEVAQVSRVHFARRLLSETDLPISRIAFSSGFRSLRRFNEAMLKSFGAPPSSLRRERARPQGREKIELRTCFRPPFDWESLLEFLRPRAIPGVESVEGGIYRRTFRKGAEEGILEVRCAPREACLWVRIEPGEAGSLFEIVERVRCLFDCGADPIEIGRILRQDKVVGDLARRRPGLRVPGSWDGFELAVRAILGQQVSVAAATTLTGRLVQRFGTPLRNPNRALTHLFPRPADLATADLSGLGIPRSRARALRELARAVMENRIDLLAGSPREPLKEMPGVGDWTAEYVAMRALGDPDAFPADDLGLRRAAGKGRGPISGAELNRRSESWRPWRAYAAMHLWKSLEERK